MEKKKTINTTVHHLFREESGRMVSVLVKIFGGENYELAEDVAQDALLSALETWKMRGLPENPKAWLYRVAKNKAIDIIRKQKHQQNVDFNSPEHKLLTSEYTIDAAMNQMWNEENIQDDFLGMMYACCLPQLSEENQIAFILKSLCGFSTREIAKAFLTSEDTVSKRIYRAKEFFRKSKLRPTLPSHDELSERTLDVLNVIYLIFSEGYNPTHNDALVREDLLEQAFALNSTLLKSDKTKKPEVFALMALMCFHTSRIPARTDKEGQLISLARQDRSLWNQSLIETGNYHMSLSAHGNKLSQYHLEAAISYEHCIATTYHSTNWRSIFKYYDTMLIRKFDPVIFLNQTIVSMELSGPQAALDRLKSIPKEKLDTYYLYHATLGEIYQRLGEHGLALDSLERAKNLTPSIKERQFLSEKIAVILN